MSDIHDGAIYQYCSMAYSKSRFYVSKGMLGRYGQLSFTISIDGIRGYRKTGWSIYPIWISTNELPISLRFKSANVYLAGLWFSTKKPKMNLLLEPIIESINSLQSGYLLTDRLGSVVRCSAILLCAVMDTPGKSDVLNHKHHNGYYGCPVCLHRSNRKPLGRKNYYDPEIEGRLRTDQDYIAAESFLASHPNSEVFLILITL
jgi:hypothetical protein